MTEKFDMQKAREICEKATFHLTGVAIDEDLKILVDQASLLPAALDRIEELENEAKALIGTALDRMEDQQATIESLKAALVLMHINELSRDGKAFHDYTPDAEIQLAREMPEIFGDAK